jgi:predicted metalloprotease with PDZ domain
VHSRVHRTRAVAAAVAVIALASTASTSAAQEHGPGGSSTGTWYTVTIPPYDRRLVRIEARIELTDSVLLMYPEGADHVPESWATYVRGLAATDDAGRAVALRYLGGARWSVLGSRPPAVRLRYEVLLHHDAGRWPFGSKEAAYVKEDGAFVTGKALFIAQYGLPPARVRFALPPGWRLATPWAEAPRDSSSFAVPHVRELLEVGMLAGRHEQRRLTVGETTVIVAVGQSLAGSTDLLDRTIRPTIPMAASLFGGTPRGKFVVIANRDLYDGGTAFTRSFDVVFRDPPTPANRDRWAHVIVHELLHLWLGNAVRSPDDAQEYWFTEGATDYLANLLELRTGAIARERFYERLAEHWDRYRAVVGRVSLRRAGEEKAKHYDLVYSGGLLATFVLDVELRQRTGGRVGIDSVMRRLYAEHGPGRTPFTYDDLRRVAREAGGGDVDRLFACCVEGAERLPVERALAAIGRTLGAPTGGGASRTAIRPRRIAPPAQRALERLLLDPPAGAR